MNKKILIIIAMIIISLVLLAGFIGSIVYSVKSISYDITGNQSTPHITKSNTLPPTFTGYITVGTKVDLANKGFYSIKNLQVDIMVYAFNWSVSSNHNGDQVGTGTNKLGTIASGSAYTGSLSVNITKDIPNFAVENCDLKIEINIHLIYSPLVDIPFSYSTTVYQHYTSPY